MPNGTYGGVRGEETKVGQKTFVSRPTRLIGVRVVSGAHGNKSVFDYDATLLVSSTTA